MARRSVDSSGEESGCKKRLTGDGNVGMAVAAGVPVIVMRPLIAGVGMTGGRMVIMTEFLNEMGTEHHCVGRGQKEEEEHGSDKFFEGYQGFHRE